MTKTLRATIAVLSLVALGAIPGRAGADVCNGEITPIETPGGTIYIDNRSQVPEDGDIWVYMESNDIAGLQSGGESITGLYSDDCAQDVPDTLLY
jgi:hypothetical protein